MFKIEQASRSQLKLKILISGPSGSGKTMSTLKLAHGMVGSWEKIVVIDTENIGYRVSNNELVRDLLLCTNDN